MTSEQADSPQVLLRKITDNTAGLANPASGGDTPGNPTAKVGPTATNGAAATYMRSDAAPAIDLSANYSWTGNHFFGSIIYSTDGGQGGMIGPETTAGILIDDNNGVVTISSANIFACNSSSIDFGSDITGSLTLRNTVKFIPTTIAQLMRPDLAGAGAMCFVSDATTNTRHGAVVGGGGNKVFIYSDGLSWLIF